MPDGPVNNIRRVQNANIGDNFGIINQGAGSIDTSAHWYNAQIGQQTNNIAGDQYILYVQDGKRTNPHEFTKYNPFQT
ncbi:hypothetical protein EST38_g3801 [Candolleomyces aberdarensis]|uniref:Uncharacterized protein n=1 Tax=Candolleomyces aberdarensis TaxID=2316362 RepID=A0A4Q2DPU7_9AGAR|nr:hypothetical protein EST38_g3801 [Candolleomyces aberdarensis]